MSFDPLIVGLFRLSSATLTPKRPAISSSVSPLRTAYFFRELFELRLVRSSLSRRLDRLEEEGWVQRTRPSGLDDQRAVVVELTRRGRTLWREMNVTYRRAVQAHVASALSDEDVAALRKVLALVAPDM